MADEKKKSIPEREEEILKFWEEQKIFEKSVAQRKRGGRFVFYDGPPFATGLPHYGHILASVIKDAIPRFKTMQGNYVERRWGWDCHGLPLENLVEQELGLKTKKEIEQYGVERFNRYAKESVLRYADDWKKIIPRIGRWVDMEHDYRTMDWKYSETIWWMFKTLYDKGLIYEGYKSMHLCPRCETTLANFEVSQGYKDIEDLSVTVKFELEDEPGTYVLAWTTTPWTLPGNVALAVNPTLEYVKVNVLDIERAGRGERKYINVIIAAPIYDSLFSRQDIDALKLGFNLVYARTIQEGEEGIVRAQRTVARFRGAELVGKKHKPLFNYYSSDLKLKNRENGWKIYPADFVTTDEGTGIVHIAPAFGEEDMELGKKYNFPFVQHIATDGKFKPEAKDFAGLPVKPKDNHQVTDKKIIALLEARNLLFAKQKITHSYPHCWRCDTPLLNYAASSWFVNVLAIKDDLVANNRKIAWVPEHIKEGRFGKWLEGARDWAISRSRFWGAPLPVWKCKQCERVEVIGSLEELNRKQGGSKNQYLVMRHGEALSNTKNVTAVRSGDYPLTLKGRVQAERAAKQLKREHIDVIVSSPVMRAKETAQIVGHALGIKTIAYDVRLEEVRTGVFEGGPLETYRAFFAKPADRFTRKPEGGENWNELRARMLDAVADLEKKYVGKKILLVSHEAPLWMLTAGAEGITDEEVLAAGAETAFIKCAEVLPLAYRNLPRNRDGGIEMHRPFIDSITFSCLCGGRMTRVPEVFDCWFESGTMPYGQAHYPFENKQIFDPGKQIGFPADFIAEGLDQTRGWFYSLLVLSTALFRASCYNQVIVNGTILAQDGQKMSKRLKNYPDPMDVIRQYGADAMRFYLLSSPAVYGEDLNFSLKDLDEVYKKYSLIVLNTLNFFLLYRGNKKAKVSGQTTPKHILDQWIFSRLNRTADEVTKALEQYEIHRAARPLLEFVQDLSLWYVRRSRERVKSESADARAALGTLERVLRDFGRITAPFTPFLSEMIYQSLCSKSEVKSKKSVHLEDWPTADAKLINEDLERDMELVRRIVSGALKLRAEAGVKTRQPLAKLQITNDKLQKELLKLVKDEVNVKEIVFGNEMRLDTTITPELREEGMVRELVRNIQEMRRDLGLKPKDVIRCQFVGDAVIENAVTRLQKQLQKDINAKTVTIGGKKVFKAEREIEMDGKKMWAGIY
ncbi:MAG: class I tRNA ligase family protein [Candidatus Sungbacteria bacterium]|nr:class I tRNA ligase family protein [Candidatus Sungbacteria bacterium]